MDLQELLEALSRLSDKELKHLAKAAEFELQGREREQEAMESLGLIPLYRCQDPEHQYWGLYAEDPQRKGFLICGCLKEEAELAGYE